MGEYVEQIPSLFAVACFLPGRAKDLSAPSRSSLPTFRRNLLSSSSFLYDASKLGGITSKMTVILTRPFSLWVVCWDKFHFGFGSVVLLLN